MKKVGLVVYLLLSVIIVFAQNVPDHSKEKPIVYVDYFKRADGVSFALTEGLRNHVISGLQKMRRVILVDVDSQGALSVDVSRRSSGNVSSGDDNELERLSVMKQLGAQYIITGFVSSTTTEWISGRDGGSGFYSGTVTYSLKMIEPNNGTLVGSKTYEHSGTGGNQEEALAKSCSVAYTYMDNFVDEHFKIEGVVVEVNRIKKNKAEEIYINLGSVHGVKENQKFEVFVVHEVAGHVAKKEIGRINTKAVEGETISLCKVNKGGEEILKAFNDGSKVIVISRSQTLLGDLGTIFRGN